MNSHLPLGCLCFCVLFAAALKGVMAVHVFSGDDNAVKEWIVLGPFPNEELSQPDDQGFTRGGFGVDYLKSLGGEGKARLTLGTEIRMPEGIVQAQALKVDKGEEAWLEAALGNPVNKVAYMFAEIEADQEQVGHFYVSADDGAIIWINGVEVFRDFNPAGQGIRQNPRYFHAALQKGRNPVMVKIDQKAGGWGVVMEVFNDTEALELSKRSPRLLDLKVHFGTTQQRQVEVVTPLTVSTSLHPNICPDVNLRVQVIDIRGKLLKEEGIKLGDTLELTTPPGAYRLHIRSDLFREGNELWTEDWLVTGDLREEAEATLAGMGYILDGYPSEEQFADPYAGMLAFATEQLKGNLEQPGKLDEKAVARRTYQLRSARQMQTEGPEALSRQTDSLEWAYLSRIDGTPQPFGLRVPATYNPDNRTYWKARVNLHGAGGGHFYGFDPRFLPPEHEHDHFELVPEGRGGFGSYYGNSAVDVIESTEFFLRHWPIDSNQVILTGGSMGGFGAFQIGSRFPDRWAAVAPFCGGGMQVPLENLISIPIFSLHSDDDDAVCVSFARSAINAVNEMGGRAVMAETTGFGHDIGRWAEGKAALDRWATGLHRVAAKEKRQIVFKPIDQAATKAWWIVVEKFGASDTLPEVRAALDETNTLYLSVQDAGIVRIDLDNSPAQRTMPLHVVLNGEMPVTIAEPPAQLWVVDNGTGPKVSTSKPAAQKRRYHFPGGLPAMYHGEPIMVVYGTQGDATNSAALKQFAESVSISPNAGIPDEHWRVQRFGALPIKADTEVSEDDLERYNLILIGTDESNLLVKSISKELPVQLKNGVVHLGEETWDFNGRGFGLLHFNPLRPERLIYWIATKEAESSVSATELIHRNDYAWSSPDFLLVDAGSDTVLAARNFNSDWKWLMTANRQTKVPGKTTDSLTLNEWRAEHMLRETGSELAFMTSFPDMKLKFSPEATLDDLNAYFTNYDLAGTVELTGSEILSAQSELAKGMPRPFEAQFVATPTVIEPDVTYQVALNVWNIRQLGMILGYYPKSFRLHGSYELH